MPISSSGAEGIEIVAEVDSFRRLIGVITSHFTMCGGFKSLQLSDFTVRTLPGQLDFLHRTLDNLKISCFWNLGRAQRA